WQAFGLRGPDAVDEDESAAWRQAPADVLEKRGVQLERLEHQHIMRESEVMSGRCGDERQVGHFSAHVETVGLGVLPADRERCWTTVGNRNGSRPVCSRPRHEGEETGICRPRNEQAASLRQLGVEERLQEIALRLEAVALDSGEALIAPQRVIVVTPLAGCRSR